MAEAFLLAKANGLIAVRSAGVAASTGSDASEGAKRAMAEFGVTKKHYAQQLEAELLEWADLVLTMTMSQKQLIHAYFPHSIDKVYTLKEYVGHLDENSDVLDPFGQSLSKYLATATELEGLVEKLTRKLID